jgi:hypothetical protein
MRLSRTASLAAIGLAALLLAGCENDAASYQIDGSRDDALTLIREQRWIWDDQSEVALVVARYPHCQRRHALKKSPARQARAELFKIGPQSFLLHTGQAWYAADLKDCSVQPVQPPAAEARGTALGAFDRQGDKMQFVIAAR